MDKTAIRNFAVWARNKLISDVAYRAGLMGITADGIADKLPQSTNSVQFYDIGASEPYQITGKEIAQRSNLAFLIKRKAKSSDYGTAYSSVIEEVAYTWFNRLIAVRFMEVNDYLPSHVRVLSSESGKIEPDIVTSPFDVDLGIDETESSKILELKQNNESDELFRMLFIKQCNKLSEILPRLFEKTDDYTELLFNCSYVDQEGIVYRLTHDIPEEDFDINRGGQVEIIGWLYQYYNAELKDDTFALLKKSVKITKERIPSATQLFTPDWIVRYMVENSLGRLWTDGHANTSLQLRGNWKYYLEEAEQEPDVQSQLNDIRKEYAKLRPEDIKLIDPCMGSGHILVYAFDVLMQIYESEGYNQRDAAVQILDNNIFGLDIDDRAAQLTYFAVMMKARQYNRRILDGTQDCHVLAIQESNGMSTLQTYMAPLGDLSDAALRLINAYNDAKEYGSILNVPLTLEEIDALESRLEEIRSNRSNDVEELMVEALLLDEFPPLLEQARIMVRKYDVVVTNPPYMGAANMNAKLSAFLKNNYPISKSDMSTVCMECGLKMCNENGFMAMINIPVWMFISSYEKLRENLFSRNRIVSLVYPGRGVFGSDFGTVCFVINNKNTHGYVGKYHKLFDKQSSVESVEEKEKKFLRSEGVYYFDQNNVFSIPGYPLAFWISQPLLNSFSGKTIKDYGYAGIGMRTGDNNRFLRLWFEISLPKMGLAIVDAATANSLNAKWIPYNKGGDYRKWYGNNTYVVNWYANGSEIKENTKKVYPELGDNLGWKISNEKYYFKKGITWTGVTMADFSCRLYPCGFIFDSGANGLFIDDERMELYIAAYLNCKVANDVLRMINPTVNTGAGTVNSVPVIVNDDIIDEIDNLATENKLISKKDWDSFETSWDFKKHPLI